jgi:DNA polymerase III gamma/tau subunit
MKVMNHVIQEEDLEISREVLKRIVDLSEGSPRAALVLLEQVEVLKDEDKMLQLLDLFYGQEAKVTNFCQELLNKNWKEAKAALKLLEEDAESIRRGVLGYMAKVIQNSNDSSKANRAASIFTDFSQHQYIDKSVLIWSAYVACQE